ncbi:hypothetical protein [Chelatococcus reniformis]|uniref:Uncharacterized protein n=1 Tax=Chelatococcus reniformis TaxID=1494448 RepID=A0A916X9U4_9HYPH|nr:hypothetical protein [Chelatococcus reniformis]GGC55444.1 hypothetical protein GCM10010994_12890 [Chelatococcus reniformis]
MRIEIDFSPALIEALDRFIDQQSVAVSRAEAVELMVRDWLIHNAGQIWRAIGEGDHERPRMG